MLSLIVCTRHPHDLDELRRNVDATIGMEYQWVVIDNSQNRYSLCAAYNEGVRRSKGEYLCFMHDDIIYHTMGWGKNVERHFQSTGVGMIGVIGSHIIPSVGDCRVGYTPYHVLHFIQCHHSFSHYDSYFAMHVRSCLQGSLTDVAVLDGVWFCIPKAMFGSGMLRFDEERFTSFHIYDLDISMQVVQSGRKLYVVDDVLLEHNSEGVYNESFVMALEAFLEKWKGKLPVTRGMQIDTEQIKRNAAHYRDELVARIERDRDMVAIINYWKLVNEGKNPPPLTHSQKMLSSLSEFLFMKNMVKYYPDKEISRNYLRNGLRSLSPKHRALILWKFFIYRVLRLPCSKKSVTFVIASGSPTPTKR